MSNHTPFPWRITGRYNMRGCAYGIESEDTSNPVTSNGRWGTDIYASSVDDARLIVALPELIEACQLSQEAEEHPMTCSGCEPETGMLCEEGRLLKTQAEASRLKALAKAIGEEPPQ